MTGVSVEQVREMARMMSIELDDRRASTIASRLGAVLAELDEIPDDALADVEPEAVFEPWQEERHG